MEQKSAMSRNQQQHCRHQGFRPVQSARRREQDVVWRERNGSAAAQEHKSSGPGYRAEAKTSTPVRTIQSSGQKCRHLDCWPVLSRNKPGINSGSMTKPQILSQPAPAKCSYIMQRVKIKTADITKASPELFVSSAASWRDIGPFRRPQIPPGLLTS